MAFLSQLKIKFLFSLTRSHRQSCHDMFNSSHLFSTAFFVNVDYATGKAFNNWLDSLSASFAGVQVRVQSSDNNKWDHPSIVGRLSSPWRGRGIGVTLILMMRWLLS